MLWKARKKVVILLKITGITAFSRRYADCRQGAGAPGFSAALKIREILLSPVANNLLIG
jgi:hypothetical protein